MNEPQLHITTYTHCTNTTLKERRKNQKVILHSLMCTWLQIRPKLRSIRNDSGLRGQGQDWPEAQRVWHRGQVFTHDLHAAENVTLWKISIITMISLNIYCHYVLPRFMKLDTSWSHFRSEILDWENAPTRWASLGAFSWLMTDTGGFSLLWGLPSLGCRSWVP